jgi:uncharacterized membrane protein YidH (DUF202 family)
VTDGQLMDVGAQAERTALAWQRTGIGAMAVAGLLVRWDMTEHFPIWPDIALTVVGGVAVLFLVSARYRRMLQAMRAGRTPLARGMVPAATVLMVFFILDIGIELAVSVMP